MSHGHIAAEVPPAAIARASALGAFTAFFLLALLPRLSPLLSGAVFADDLIHRPEGHLLSYRFLNYLELLLWEALFGRDYLLTAAPKIVASLYTAGLCVAVRHVLTSWGARAATATAIAAVIPLHPIWNTFICWHVTGVYVLSLLLIVAGYAMLATRPWLGISLVALGISGYQVHVGLLPTLLFAEALLRGRTVLWRRIAQATAAVAIYLAATKIAAVAGLATWGGRGVAASMGGAQWQAVSDNLATITQPLLSFYAGIEASWRLWRLPFLAVAIVEFLLLRGRRRMLALGPLLLAALAAAAILPLNVGPTGPRVAAAIWLAVLFALLPLHDRRAVPLGLALTGLLLLPISLADAANRTIAWRADQATLTAIERYWRSRGIPKSDVRIDIRRSPAAARDLWTVSRPIVLQNFAPVTPLSHSNVRQTPEWFFTRFGFRTTIAPSPGHAAVAASGRSDVATWTHLPAERRTVVTIER